MKPRDSATPPSPAAGASSTSASLPGGRYRIGFVIPNLRAGGAERQLLALAERLPRDRFEVEFLAVIGEGPLDARAAAAGVPIIRVGERPLSSLGVVRRAVGRVRKSLDLVRLVRSRQYDLIDAWFYPLDVLAAVTAPLTGSPVVVSGLRNTDHGDYFDFGPLSRPVQKLGARLVDASVGNSDAVARAAVERWHVNPRKLHVIRNGVEPIAPMGAEARAAERARLGAAPGQVLIGCVANYRDIKQHDLLIDSFALVAPEHPDARLVLVGQGPLHDRIEAQVSALGLQDRILVHGPAEDVPAMLGAFDLMVQSSRSEGLPNGLLEAAAAGRPIVASDAGGTSEIVQDGVTGLLVPIGDVEGLASAMSRAIADPELRSRMGAAAREHVERAFGMERFAAEFAALYEELLDARTRRSGERRDATRGSQARR